jgi:hypothetical protein
MSQRLKTFQFALVLDDGNDYLALMQKIVCFSVMTLLLKNIMPFMTY